MTREWTRDAVPIAKGYGYSLSSIRTDDTPRPMGLSIIGSGGSKDGVEYRPDPDHNTRRLWMTEYDGADR